MPYIRQINQLVEVGNDDVGGGLFRRLPALAVQSVQVRAFVGQVCNTRLEAKK